MAAAKTTAAKTTAPTMTAPESGVKVRMYRQGLGDCFLLAFPSKREGRPRFVLIDCGVLLGTADSGEKMKRVAEHILESTGERIDLLVATHEHWDHLSGFEQAREVFDRLKIDQVWVAWTEDLEDPVSRGLRRQRQTALRALTSTVSRLRANGDRESARAADGLDPVLGFFGELGVDGKPSAIERAMDYVVGRGKPPRYRTPGEGPLPLPGVAGARVYVLGPPKEMDFLKRSNPKSGEAYEARLGLNEETAFFAAVLAAQDKAGPMAMSPDEEELANLSHPFEKVFRVGTEAAQRDPFFQELYYGSSGKAPDAWRRIDSDWMGAAGSLALQLDSNTNNTSLALAIELVPSGQVLLFPGDAQAGNWRSWHTLEWPREDDPDHPVTIEDLMSRTVLYKVGHHASHNATLREQGLELMTHPDLVAMIPVDSKMAHKPKGGSPNGWDMPFPPLLKRLKEKTNGRVLRVDEGLPKRPRTVSAGEWKPFQERCEETDLYVEITIPG
ncbi:MAG TPA: MBL fold metallo-hydrolase [Thermoanaerobaculia bacterium]|nr:MBL fold metallo-hydrolase [Thermoanaerobaculia bacterium]